VTLKFSQSALLALGGLMACGPVTQGSPSGPDEVAPAVVEPEASAVAAAASVPDGAPTTSLADDFVWPNATDYVRISTSKGDILVELYGDKAPLSVANFLQYAAEGHYDRTVFHRVVKGFVVQGGGYTAYYNERLTREPVAYEGDNGLPNFRSTLAMARGSIPNSATSQWYFNLRDNNERLDHRVNDLGPRYGYTVFGRVIDGMPVADAIGAVPTGPAGPFKDEVPVEAVIVTRVERLAARPGITAVAQ